MSVHEGLANSKFGEELEIKYYVADLPAVARRLQSLGARLIHSRAYEVNLRFDTPSGDLQRQSQVLRLRLDTQARLTFKGPDRPVEGVRARQEIEFTVQDFDAAQAFLEALGYQVWMRYEKYRQVYELDGVEACLDELPYGAFVELEGTDPGRIHHLSQRLGFDEGRRAPGSYIAIFNRLRKEQGLDFRDLSFENFRGLQISAADLHLLPADQ